MKKIKSFIVLSLVFFLCGQMMGQSSGAFYLGASFPMKDFAKFDGFENFALTDANSNQGGAAIGFNAGLKWYFNMGVKGLGVMFSLDGFYNGPNADLETAYRNNEGQIGSSGSFAYNSTPKFINVPAMVGLNYIYNFNPSFGLYIEAGAGGNVRFITPMETVGTLMVAGVENKEIATQEYDVGFSFAWQAGAGIEVAKNFRVGCSFYNLGKAVVKGEETVKRTIGNNTSLDTPKYNTLGTLNPVMVLARIGFSF